MSGVRPEEKRVTLRALFLAAGVAALGHATAPAAAQETGALRGEVTEAAVNDALFGSRLRDGPLSADGKETADDPQYAPASPGAVADEAPPGDGSIFADAAPDDDPFLDAPTPSSRPPSTAKERAERARDEAAAAPRSTTERRKAEQEARTGDVDTTGTVPVGTVDSEVYDRIDPGAERAEAIEGLDRQAEENPYAPLGLRLGSFVVSPTLETGLTWTSNADYSAAGAPALLSETTLRLNAASDWSRHSATINAYGTLRKSVSGAELDEKQAGVDASLRLDLADGLRALASLGYERRPESASSPVVIVGTVGQPIRQTLSGSLGLEKDAGKLRFGLTGRVEKDIYGDADLSAGGVLSQRDRNSTLATMVLRGGYAISPALTPFVEAELGRRFYDLRLDSSGYERSATRLGARAGLEFDLGEKFSGEVSAGFIREKMDDLRLTPISGATVNADLNWSPRRGTTVGLTGSTTVEGSTTPGESGSILYSAGLRLEREMRANLTGTIGLGAGYRVYDATHDHDTLLSAEAGLTYWLNRYAGLTGRVRHERQSSSLAGRDYQINSVFLGLKLQR